MQTSSDTHCTHHLQPWDMHDSVLRGAHTSTWTSENPVRLSISSANEDKADVSWLLCAWGNELIHKFSHPSCLGSCGDLEKVREEVVHHHNALSQRMRGSKRKGKGGTERTSKEPAHTSSLGKQQHKQAQAHSDKRRATPKTNKQGTEQDTWCSWRMVDLPQHQYESSITVGTSTPLGLRQCSQALVQA